MIPVPGTVISAASQTPVVCGPAGPAGIAGSSGSGSGGSSSTITGTAGEAITVGSAGPAYVYCDADGIRGTAGLWYAVDLGASWSGFSTYGYRIGKLTGFLASTCISGATINVQTGMVGISGFSGLVVGEPVYAQSYGSTVPSGHNLGEVSQAKPPLPGTIPSTPGVQFAVDKVGVAVSTSAVLFDLNIPTDYIFCCTGGFTSQNIQHNNDAAPQDRKVSAYLIAASANLNAMIEPSNLEAYANNNTGSSGMRFSTPSTPQTLSAIRVYLPASSTQTSLTVKLWSDSGTALVSATNSSSLAIPGWNSVPISYTLAAATTYRVAYDCQNYGIQTNTVPTINGGFSVVSAGCYGNPGTFPNGTSNQWFGVDFSYLGGLSYSEPLPITPGVTYSGAANTVTAQFESATTTQVSGNPAASPAAIVVSI